MSRVQKTAIAILGLSAALALATRPAGAAGLIVTVTSCTNNTIGGRRTTAVVKNTGPGASAATTVQVGVKCTTNSQWGTYAVPTLPANGTATYTYNGTLKCCCFAKVTSNGAYSSICPASKADGETDGPELSTWGNVKVLYK